MRLSRPITLTDSAACIIHTDDRRFLFQLRDDKTEIPFPNHWCCFGGTLEAGETPREALFRELKEELEFTPQTAVPFYRQGVDLRDAGRGQVVRHYFSAEISAAQYEALVQHEGRGRRLFTQEEIFSGAYPITPYDGYAFWLFANMDQFRI